jgi:hypothetical protein
MTHAGTDYTTIVLLYASMVIITATLAVEYNISKTRSRDQKLLPPCYITWQNPSYNLVFIAVPMGVLMACKLKISWELGAIGIIPISETLFNMAIYAMQQLWKQHYTIVFLAFACTCLQLLLIDFCDNGVPWRCISYFCVQLFMELAQIFNIKYFNPSADAFQSSEFNTFNSMSIILMDLLSIWCNALYTQSLLQITYPKSISPYWLDTTGGICIWSIFSVSYLLQLKYPHWNIWSANKVNSIQDI